MRVVVGNKIYIQAADPDRDKEYRNQARSLIEKLRNAVNNKLHYEWTDTEIFGEPTSYATVWFDVGEVDPVYDDLVIYFMPTWRGEGHAIGEYKHKDTVVWEGKDSIALWGLPGQDPRTRENAVKGVAKALTTHSGTLLHELIHYFDQKRYFPLDEEGKGPKTYESKREREKYLNSPQEFNAYYQQWAARTEERLDSQVLSKYDPGTLDAINAFYYLFSESAERFATYHLSNRGLNDKLRRHFLKRAVQFYNSMHQEVTGGKQVVDPVSNISDRYDLVHWLENVEKEVKKEFAKEWGEEDSSGRKDLLTILTDFEQFLSLAQDFSRSARDWIVKKLPTRYKDDYLDTMEQLRQELTSQYSESVSKTASYQKAIVASSSPLTKDDLGKLILLHKNSVYHRCRQTRSTDQIPLVVAGKVYRRKSGFTGNELHVYDFDECLFKSPDKPPWWSPKTWWSNEESLLSPCVPEKPSASWWVSDVVSAAKESIGDDTVYTVMITGRLKDEFADRITELLNQKGLKFDELRFKQSFKEKTDTYKARHIRSVAKKFQDQIDTIQIWDDQQDNLDEVKEHLEERGYKVITHYVEPQINEIDCTEKEYDEKKSISS